MESKILTNENYYEPDEYMSVSAYKVLQKCEYMGILPFGTPSKDMLIGSYVDSYVEGTLESFKNEHPEILSSRGVSKGELKAEFKLADEICRFISEDKVFSQFMSGEKQTIMTGNIGGVPFKIKMDSYSPHIAINDLKVMRTITNSRGQYYNFISEYGYDIQAACYQEIVRQNTGEQLPFFICAVTKETPINSAIINVPQELMDRVLYDVSTKIQHLYEVKMGKIEAVGCGKCPKCISRRKETPIISMYDFADFMI